MNAKNLLLRVAMSVEQTRRRLRAAGGVIRELKVQVQRVTGHQAAHEALQSLSSRNECSPQSNRHEVTYPVGGAEEVDT